MMTTDSDDDRAGEALARVRAICLSLPETNERTSHGAPCFFIRDKKTFLYFHDDHHGDGRISIWCAAPAGVAQQMIEAEPLRFFRPPYVGTRGWLGLDLAVDPDWDETAAIITESFRQVAPAAVTALLDD